MRRVGVYGGGCNWRRCGAILLVRNRDVQIQVTLGVHHAVELVHQRHKPKSEIVVNAMLRVRWWRIVFIAVILLGIVGARCTVIKRRAPCRGLHALVSAATNPRAQCWRAVLLLCQVACAR